MAKISTGSTNQAENAVNQAVESVASGAVDSISGVNNILGGIVSRSSSEEGDGSGTASDSGGYGLPVNTESGPVYDPNPDKRMANDRRIAQDAREKQGMRIAPPAPPAATAKAVRPSAVSENAPKSISANLKTAMRANGSPAMIDDDTGEIIGEATSDVNSLVDMTLPRGSTILSAGQPAPGTVRERVMNADDVEVSEHPRKPQSREGKPVKQPKSKTGNRRAPNRPKPPETPEDAVNRVMEQYEVNRVNQARQRDIETYRDYAQWRADNPGKSGDEYLQAINPSIDNENFSQMGSLPDEQTRNLDDYSAEVAKNGLRKEAEENAFVQKEKNTYKQDRLIGQTARDMVRGFFRIKGMRVKKDEDGNETLRWSDRVEQEMVEILRYANRENTVENQRNIMRSVRMYASMSIDRHGKMFNEDESEWSLTEDEAINIMRLMRRSCIEYGTPFAMVSDSAELRGTKIFPCGVVPKVVADFWTAPGSNLGISSAELVQRSQDEWTKRTRPAMIATLTDDKMAQRIVIEDMARAISILDGMSPERFSERYGVRTEIDYMISEWQDANVEYAAVMSDYIDVDAVTARSDRILQGYREQIDRQRGVTYVYDDDGNLESTVTKRQRGWVSGLKLATKLMRTGSIAANLPIIISAFAEHGVGNLYTRMTIATLNHMYGTNYDLSDFTVETMRSDEALDAFQCVKQLYDSFGPSAVRLFSETGLPYTKENVIKFAEENLKPKVGETARKWKDRFDKLTHNLMVADYAFKRSDLQLWFNAYLVTNSIMARSQQNLANERVLSEREAPLSPEEIESAIRASDMGTFFAQAMGTDAGINAYQMMRANNIGQKSPMSEFANQFLNDHGVTEFAITAFVDTFPKYGINFAYMLVPFSRTFSYLKAKSNYEQDVGGNTADLLIGGNVEDFQLGLRMNLIYDAYTFGMRSVVVGALFGILLNALGFEPPDDDENKFNVSMWKIGGKVGWGENGNGIEIQVAWWMNDLTLLSLPIAYLTAGWLSTDDLDLAKNLMLDGLGDTISGNVLLDFARTVNHWREDYIEFDRMINEDGYEGPRDPWSFALSEAAYSTVKALGKMNPIDPLVNSFNRDTLFAGEDARNRDFSRVYRRSDNEELDKFYQDNKVMDKVSYDEYMRRKYSSNNLLFALFNNITSGAFTDDKKTGFFWWDMPARTMGDPIGYAWLGEFYMDLDNIPDDVEGSTPAEKEINYKDQMARKVLEWIDRFDGATNQAMRAGFMIPEPARDAATNYCFAQISALKNDYAARVEASEVSKYDKVERNKMNQEIDKWEDYIYNWLKNDDIPSYADTYEQLLTDNEVTYVWRSNGQPAPSWASLMPGMTDAIYKPKGNHPTSFAPFTTVDTRDRGYNAETLSSWFRDGETGSDLQWIFDNIGQNELQFGRDAGKIANDVIFSKQTVSGEYADMEHAVIGYRSYVDEQRRGLPDSIREITEENHDGGKLGEAGKYNQATEDLLNGNDKSSSTSTSKIPTYYPRSTYGYSSRAGSGNYNPKIYSNPRSINADKAATMYAKTPGDARINSYLRPSFSTKGSREAYKRQDI